MRFTSLGTLRLMVAAAFIEMFLGLAIYVFPLEFAAPAYDPLRLYFPFLSAALMAGGVVLFVGTRYLLHPWVDRCLPIVAAVPLGVLAGGLARTAVWSGTAFYGLLAVALLAAPWLIRDEGERGSESGLDLFEVTMSLILATVGILMLLQPRAFATPAYGGLAGLLPLAGAAGLVGAAALLRSAFRRWRRVGGLWRIAGAALPLLMVYNWMFTAAWTGVLAWGTVALALLVGSGLRDGAPARRVEVAGQGTGEPDPYDGLERTIESWTWLLALVVVALTALGGAFAFPSAANLFVLAASGYNLLVHRLLPGLGTPDRRVVWHLIFLTVALGLLLFGAGPDSYGFLALLVATPPLISRILGPAAGRRMLGLALTVVVASEVVSWLSDARPISLVIAIVMVKALVLAVAAEVGIRSAGEQRRLLQDLVGARAHLQQQVNQLALLDRIGNAIRRSLDLDVILQTAAEQLGRTMSSSRCFIELVQGDHPLPVSHAYSASGVAPLRAGCPACQPIFRLAAQTRLAVAVSDVISDPRTSQAKEEYLTLGVRSMLVVPVLAGNELLGVMSLHRSVASEWTPAETDFVEGVAGQAAVAVVHARTHRTLARRHEDLQQAHEELQAQREELQAQQEELQAMNEELTGQGVELLRQRDELEVALESVRQAEAVRARLVAILEATPDFVATADPEGRVLYYNKAARQMLGIGEHEDISEIRIPDTHSELAMAIAVSEGLPTAARDGVWRGETALLSRHGREIPISQVILAHKGPNGNVEYFSTIARDITEEKQAKEALREKEERFRLAFSHAPIGISLVRTDGRFLQANQALCEMLGYPEPELCCLTYQDITHPEDLDRDNECVHRLLAGEMDSYQMEKRYLHRDGQVVLALLCVSLVRDRRGTPLYFIAQIQDITGRKRTEARLAHLADHDPLTDLWNRRRFQEELQHHLVQVRPSGRGGAVLFLDLDEFKYVNDTLGHMAGDHLLCSLAARLQAEVSEPGIVARLGGDEFGILLPGGDAAQAKIEGDRMLEIVRQHTVVVDGQAVGITASIGIALFPAHGATVEELLAHADVALYRAKENGRKQCAIYEPDRNWETQMEARLTWEQRIREALDQEGFTLVCQPIRNLNTDEVTQYELLLRMVGEHGELIRPGAFLGVAESYGLIHAIDRWVVRRAIHMLAVFQQEGRVVSLAVNLSGKAFADTGLLSLIQEELAATGVDPRNLLLEITETAAVADLNQARKFIETLNRLGCRFAIDDFGTGFASFSHLKHLPVDYIKIDGSFIVNLVNDPVDQHLVRAMAEVARCLGKQTIAEFVSDAESVRLLKQFGVDYAQGFFIGKPRAVSQGRDGWTDPALERPRKDW